MAGAVASSAARRQNQQAQIRHQQHQINQLQMQQQGPFIMIYYYINQIHRILY